MEYVILVVVILITGVIGVRICARRTTVFEFERGLKYTKGRFKRLLEPGQYWYLPFFSAVTKVDMRPCFVSITGQEVLSSDGVTLKVSLAANYEITDPDTAINKVQSYHEALYLELQLALREIIGQRTIDEVLENRHEVSKELMRLTEKKVEQLGLKLISVNLKDIMFPGALKQMFAQVVNARKEGLAALEKARGETAALRNLANAAKMIDSNPNLMQLRLLQSLGGSSGNTLILGIPAQSTTVPIKAKHYQEGSAKELPDES